jgi:hypothetical protein
VHQRDEQLDKNFCLEKRQANAKARGMGVKTCLGTHDHFKPLIGESHADIVCL